MEQCLYSGHGPNLLLSPSLLKISFLMILLRLELDYGIEGFHGNAPLIKVVFLDMGNKLYLRVMR